MVKILVDELHDVSYTVGLEGQWHTSFDALAMSAKLGGGATMVSTGFTSTSGIVESTNLADMM